MICQAMNPIRRHRHYRGKCRGIGTVIAAALLAATILATATSWAAPPEDETKATSADAPPAVKEYLGRTVAQTMHYTGAPWLIRSEREREERGSEMIKALNVKPGQIVCDMGCGNGYHSLVLAELVGEKGRVLAVDIQREMLLLLAERAKKAGVGNIETVLGLPYDAKLAAGSVDLILLVDVYHEFSHPEPMLRSMRKALKPGGRIALVEFRAEDAKVPIKPEHKMSKEQILKEFPSNGFKLVAEFDKLPWQHLMFFESDPKADAAKAAK